MARKLGVLTAEQIAEKELIEMAPGASRTSSTAGTTAVANEGGDLVPRYWNTFSQAFRDSESELGYPYVLADKAEQNAEGTTEIAVATADAILAEVGTDPELAAAALEAEQARENTTHNAGGKAGAHRRGLNGWGARCRSSYVSRAMHLR